MKIILDMQGTQTASANRGIGRYSLALARALFENAGDHEIYFFFNKRLGLQTNQLLLDFVRDIPSEHILNWEFDTNSLDFITDDQEKRNAEAFCREAYIKRMKPDVLHICSPFEGYEVINGVKEFAPDVWTSATLFDLIPLIHKEHYLTDSGLSAWYFSRLSDLQKTDALLAISEFSANEGRDLLDRSPSSIRNVGCSVDSIFNFYEKTEDDLSPILQRLGISNNFILVPAGNDPRKNLEIVVEAFSMLPSKITASYQLVFGGMLTKESQEKIKNVATNNMLGLEKIIFTEYISDQDLAELYARCSLFVFPSWHEGFGLPALEAMSCGAKVIAAGNTSIKEVVNFQDALFDPFDVHEISIKIEKALSDEKFKVELSKNNSDQVSRFSWKITALECIKFWENQFSQQQQKAGKVV